MSARLGASLCAGIGGQPESAVVGPLNFAYRRLDRKSVHGRSWGPAALADGRVAAFHGYFDNAAAVAAELDADASNLARLYGLAVERWGEEADRKIIGEYCALIAHPESKWLRLSRSPLRAPPLHYFHDERLVAASSVPRALFAAGVEQRLNERRVSDSAIFNFSNVEESWFEGVSRVPLGSIVTVAPDRPRDLREYYNPLDLPPVRMKSDDAYVARAGELLDEAVRTCLAGFTRPGVTLSGGLDSPQVAVRALAALPSEQKLPTFTFHPEEGFDGRVRAGNVGDERPLVEAFAAMHPRLEPHFTANAGYAHDHRWNDFFHLMGAAPSWLCNMYVWHGLAAGAAREGCDVLLLSEWGNDTFSDEGHRGFVEYLVTGRWRQLHRAIARRRSNHRSWLAKFFAWSVLPLLPDRLWRLAWRLGRPKEQPILELIQPLSPQFRASSGADRRRNALESDLNRLQPRSRRHALKLLFRNRDAEGSELYQAFEQMYGVAHRDPMAYRPFVEFCLGLPVKMFLRDGETRWLAKQMAKGIMPEEQRANALHGRWDADWHLRIGRRRADFLAELDNIATDERLADMFDIPRLRAALADWPSETEVDPQKYAAREAAVPRALLTARFINYVEGRNNV